MSIDLCRRLHTRTSLLPKLEQLVLHFLPGLDLLVSYIFLVLEEHMTWTGELRHE